jgi:hypothetical protein
MPNRNYGLGRIHMPDERDHRFLMPQRIPEAAQVAKRLWGREWGEGGRAWISFKDLDKLIKSDGEAATDKELLLVS